MPCEEHRLLRELESAHGFFEGRYIVYNGNKRNGV